LHFVRRGVVLRDVILCGIVPLLGARAVHKQKDHHGRDHRDTAAGARQNPGQRRFLLALAARLVLAVFVLVFVVLIVVVFFVVVVLALVVLVLIVAASLRRPGLVLVHALGRARRRRAFRDGVRLLLGGCHRGRRRLHGCPVLRRRYGRQLAALGT